MVVADAHVFPGFLAPVLTQLSFQSHQLIFSQASEMRGDNTPDGWLVVLRFNATLTAKIISWRSVTAHVFPGFLTPVLTQISFQNHRLLFSHASVEVTGQTTPERKLASTGSRTHNHKVMSPTRSPPSHLGGATIRRKK